jgi:hypothetical protein
VEAYNPTNYHIILDYLGTTQKRKPEGGTTNLKKENPQLEGTI